MTLINYLENKYKGSPKSISVAFLKSNYRPYKMEEYSPLQNDNNTSFVIDKGQIYKLCLRDKKSGKLHDINTLMFVNLHELTHLYNATYGHDSDFWKSFKFILDSAVELGIYKPINYNTHPRPYCGIVINHNPLFG
jgi:hypothetical protein